MGADSFPINGETYRVVHPSRQRVRYLLGQSRYKRLHYNRATFVMQSMLLKQTPYGWRFLQPKDSNRDNIDAIVQSQFKLLNLNESETFSMTHAIYRPNESLEKEYLEDLRRFQELREKFDELPLMIEQFLAESSHRTRTYQHLMEKALTYCESSSHELGQLCYCYMALVVSRDILEGYKDFEQELASSRFNQVYHEGYDLVLEDYLLAVQTYELFLIKILKAIAVLLNDLEVERDGFSGFEYLPIGPPPIKVRPQIKPRSPNLAA